MNILYNISVFNNRTCATSQSEERILCQARVYKLPHETTHLPMPHLTVVLMWPAILRLQSLLCVSWMPPPAVPLIAAASAPRHVHCSFFFYLCQDKWPPPQDPTSFFSGAKTQGGPISWCHHYMSPVRTLGLIHLQPSPASAMPKNTIWWAEANLHCHFPLNTCWLNLYKITLRQK